MSEHAQPTTPDTKQDQAAPGTESHRPRPMPPWEAAWVQYHGAANEVMLLTRECLSRNEQDWGAVVLCEQVLGWLRRAHAEKQEMIREQR